MKSIQVIKSAWRGIKCPSRLAKIKKNQKREGTTTQHYMAFLVCILSLLAATTSILSAQTQNEREQIKKALEPLQAFMESLVAWKTLPKCEEGDEECYAKQIKPTVDRCAQAAKQYMEQRPALRDACFKAYGPDKGVKFEIALTRFDRAAVGFTRYKEVLDNIGNVSAEEMIIVANDCEEAIKVKGGNLGQAIQEIENLGITK